MILSGFLRAFSRSGLTSCDFDSVKFGVTLFVVSETSSLTCSFWLFDVEGMGDVGSASSDMSGLSEFEELVLASFVCLHET